FAALPRALVEETVSILQALGEGVCVMRVTVDQFVGVPRVSPVGGAAVTSLVRQPGAKPRRAGCRAQSGGDQPAAPGYVPARRRPARGGGILPRPGAPEVSRADSLVSPLVRFVRGTPTGRSRSVTSGRVQLLPAV